MLQKTWLRVILVLAALAALLGESVSPVSALGVTTIQVTEVQPGRRVHLVFYNLPIHDEFALSMRRSGTKAAFVVAHVVSQDGEIVDGWFEIPPEIAESVRITLTIDDGAGYSVSTAFDNRYLVQTSYSGTAALPVIPTMLPPAKSTISIVRIQRGGFVVAKITNLPANTQFTVRVGVAGTQGINGHVVGHLDTGHLAGQEAFGTFEIPTVLAGDQILDLRVEAPGYLYTISFTNADF